MTYTFERKIDLNYLYPKYIMVYCNIIQPIAVGGEYRKLIKIVPLEKNDLEYTTHYFKHKEFYSLENTEIDTIHIHLATHDGQELQFISNQDIIVNLEFSNYFSE